MKGLTRDIPLPHQESEHSFPSNYSLRTFNTFTVTLQFRLWILPIPSCNIPIQNFNTFNVTSQSCATLSCHLRGAKTNVPRTSGEFLVKYLFKNYYYGSVCRSEVVFVAPRRQMYWVFRIHCLQPASPISPWQREVSCLFPQRKASVVAERWV